MLNPVIVCPKCEAIQFTVPLKYIREAKNPNHFMEIMTADKGKKDCPTWKMWGRCKVSGCNGYWWRKGYLNIKVPATAKKHAAERLKEGDFR